ncbi:MAG: transcriptional repressor LexA [bacterium]|nr:transcriptional repressor LexA [bacterium]
MEKTITKRQFEALKIIYQSIKSSGFPPSMAEMRESLNVASNQSIINLLKALEDDGCIKKEDGLARGLRILPKGYKTLGVDLLAPVVGDSSCGPFIEAIQEVGNWMDLPGTIYKDDVKESQDKLYIIQVHGDSMINAGINDGDMLLVKQSREYKNGDIVVARSDDGTTVKRFVAENKKAYLKPENPAYKNIPFFQETFLDGKIIANLSTLKRAYEPKN